MKSQPKLELKIAGREPNSIVDGTGMRYVIFFQGCPHHCEGCHNMETWNINGGITSSIENEINLLKNYIGYIDGITISGGDPFFQYEGLLSLLKAIKNEFNLNIWVYTGYTIEEIKSTPPKLTFNPTQQVKSVSSTSHLSQQTESASPHNNNMSEALDYIDTLVDGKFILSQKSPKLPFVGSNNQRVIKIK